MSQTLQLKRGQSANLPALLTEGEPAFTLDTKKLYVGTGAENVLINPDTVPKASSASKLTTARTISLTGDATGSASFDGSANKAITVTLAASGATAGTYPKVTVDAKGRVTAGASLAAADIPTLTMAKISDAGTAAKVNTGTSSGNVPVLDSNGKLPEGVVPALAISDTFEAASETAMLALSGANKGDVCVRTDINKTFILKAAPASTLANWLEMRTPTDTVLSVNGMTGAVTVSTITGNAGSATKLATARSITVNLASTTAGSFNGTANITPGVSGTLPVARGGTGLTAAPSLLVNLAATSAASVMAASPRPGVTGALGLENGGTGATTAAAARSALGCLGTADVIDGGTF